MDIYWVENKEKRGPSTVPDIIRRIQLGEIEETCLAWHSGCEKWTPIKELPALREYINDKPSPIEEEEQSEQEAFLSAIKEKYAQQAAALSSKEQNEASESGKADQSEKSAKDESDKADESSIEQSAKTDKNEASSSDQSDKDESEEDKKAAIKIIRVDAPSSGQRFFARMIDINLYLMLYMFVIYLLDAPFSKELLPASVFVWIPFIIIEAVYLHFWGNTPGKAIMGIKVRYAPALDSRIPFAQCLRRSFMVYVLGTGMILLDPRITLVALSISWWILRSRGITPWDSRSKCIPMRTKPISTSRNIGAIAICFIALIFTGNFMQPWILPIYTEIAEKSPEKAAEFRAFMPREIQDMLPLSPVNQEIAPGVQHFAPSNPSSTDDKAENDNSTRPATTSNVVAPQQASII